MFPLCFVYSLMIQLQVEQYLLEKLEEPGYEDFYLLEVKFNPANKKVEVFLDRDAGLSLEEASRLNRHLQSRIDESGILGEKYTLDVSSPGIGRPLQLPRQYRSNIGRKLEVDYRNADGPQKQKGILTQVLDDSRIILQFDKKRKQGKKRITESVDLEIPFEHIDKAVVKISF